MDVHLHMTNFQYGKLSDRERYERESRLKIRQEENYNIIDQELINPVHLKPLQYAHILDTNSNVSRLVEGPQTLTLQAHEKLIHGPSPCISMPPDHYCIIENPVLVDNKNHILFDSFGQAKLRHAEQEIRYNCGPISLHPGERLISNIIPLPILFPHTAIRLQAISEFVDTFSEEGIRISRKAEEEWHIEGPRCYVPHPCVKILCVDNAIVIKMNQALKLRAKESFYDKKLKMQRETGDLWVYAVPGPFIISAQEEIVETIEAVILDDVTAVHLKALNTFVDRFGKQRKMGDEWILTRNDVGLFIPSIHEELVAKETIVKLSKRQYCIIKDPYNSETESYQLGKTKIVRGETSFFLHPRESLKDGIQDVPLLGPDEAAVLRALETCEYDGKKVEAGQKWIVYGPLELVPSKEVEIAEKRKALFQFEPLHLYFLYWQRCT